MDERHAASRAAVRGKLPSGNACRDADVSRRPVAKMGPVPRRTGVGHRAGGLLGRRRRLVLLPLGAGRFTGLPLERGRHGAASATKTSRFASPCRCGTARTPSSRRGPYGLTNSQGNHGEDVKECWWYLDATPTSSWLQWRYHYPQASFPYDDLVAENARRDRHEPEYELMDTGIFDAGRYFVVTVTWAKAGPEEILWQIEVHNAGPDHGPPRRPSHDLVPQPLELGPRCPTADPEPRRRALSKTWPAVRRLGRTRLLVAGPGPDGNRPEPLFCDNDTNTQKLWGTPGPALPQRRHLRPRRASGRQR